MSHPYPLEATWGVLQILIWAVQKHCPIVFAFFMDSGLLPSYHEYGES